MNKLRWKLGRRTPFSFPAGKSLLYVSRPAAPSQLYHRNITPLSNDSGGSKHLNLFRMKIYMLVKYTRNN